MPAYTALMAAAGTGDLDAVQCLLEHGADVKAKTPTGFTALIAAALSGNAKIVEVLLERGADPNAVCTLERGILQTPAGVAASMGHADCLRLLMAKGADVNAQGGPFDHSALLGAATTPSKETVHLLLAKADLNAAWAVTKRLNLNATLLGTGTWIDGNRDFTIERLKAPGYVTANLAGSFDLTEHFAAYARVENLFNHHYEEPIGYLQPTLAAYAGIKVKF